MELGARLRQARLDAGLSQRQLCGETITRNMLSQIENGSARPSMDTLRYLADRLGKPMSYFLEEQVVVLPNQQVMDRARAATGQDVLDALKEYQCPDEIFDRERWLLEALTCLELAEKALAEEKREYAANLLERAEKAGSRTPYYTPELQRRKQLLRFRAGFLPADQLGADDRELLLWGQAALAKGDPEKALHLLLAVDEAGQERNFWLGQTYLQLSQYEKAIEVLLQAEAYAPQGVYAGLEHCYGALEDYKMAYFYACKQRTKHPEDAL